MITPLRNVGAGGDQENVMFLTPGVTVKVCGEPLGAGNERNDVALDGNILVCLLLFRLLKFCLLHIFASICSIVIKFRFTKVLHAFVEV